VRREDKFISQKRLSTTTGTSQMPLTRTSKLSPVRCHGGRSSLQRACVPKRLVFHTLHGQGLCRIQQNINVRPARSILSHTGGYSRNSNARGSFSGLNSNRLPYKKLDKRRHPRTCSPKYFFFMTEHKLGLDPLLSESTHICVLVVFG
jgi:hypothetical protein